MKEVIEDKKWFLGEKPHEYERLINSLGQEIVFYEHPTFGDMDSIFVYFPKEDRLFDSNFFELDDMLADHKEYEPVIVDGVGLFKGNA